jgi:hypothetical protein
MHAAAILTLALLWAAPAGATDVLAQTTGTPTYETQSEPESSETQPGAEATPMPAPTGMVARATFTSLIVEREPTDTVASLPNDQNVVYYFTELQGMEGLTIFHRWQFGGEVMADVPFTVAGPRWRVYSSKALVPGWLGEWTVTVVDEHGNELRTDRFTYVKAEELAPAPPASPMEPPASPMERSDTP